METLQVHDRHADDRTLELAGVQVIQHAAYSFDAVQFIAVHGGGEAERGPGLYTVDHQHRGVDVDAFKGLRGRPGEACGGFGWHFTPEQHEFLQRHGHRWRCSGRHLAFDRLIQRQVWGPGQPGGGRGRIFGVCAGNIIGGLGTDAGRLRLRLKRWLRRWR